MPFIISDCYHEGALGLFTAGFDLSGPYLYEKSVFTMQPSINPRPLAGDTYPLKKAVEYIFYNVEDKFERLLLADFRYANAN